MDCAAEHTSQVIAVAQLPDGLTYEGTAALTTFALETCYPAQRKVLGTSQLGVRLTAFNLGYFGPTAEQQAAGARWLRCDLVLGNGDKLLPLPGRLKVGRFPFSTKVVALPGRPRLPRHRLRQEAHLPRHRPRSRWTQSATRPRRRGSASATERCRGATSSRTYRFSWPSKLGWKVGDHTLVCYTQTRR